MRVFTALHSGEYVCCVCEWVCVVCVYAVSVHMCVDCVCVHMCMQLLYVQLCLLVCVYPYVSATVNACVSWCCVPVWLRAYICLCAFPCLPSMHMFCLWMFASLFALLFLCVLLATTPTSPWSLLSTDLSSHKYCDNIFYVSSKLSFSLP